MNESKTKSVLSLIAVLILVGIILGLVWSFLRNKEQPIKDVFTPATQDEFVAPVQTNDGKG